MVDTVDKVMPIFVATIYSEKPIINQQKLGYMFTKSIFKSSPSKTEKHDK